jgi:hypothetical protein
MLLQKATAEVDGQKKQAAKYREEMKLFKDEQDKKHADFERKETENSRVCFHIASSSLVPECGLTTYDGIA